MLRKHIIHTGQRFAKLTVLAPEHALMDAKGQRRRAVLVRCDCGRTFEVLVYSLVCGNTTSCGCWHRGVIRKREQHHEGDTRLYRTWESMLGRCRRPRDTGYMRYGGRGIAVCMEWQTSFVAFRDWALAHGYRDDLTTDRIDVNGGYEPANCRFIPRSMQSRNLTNNRRLTCFGETKLLIEWSEDPRCVVVYNTLAARINHGWTPERALSQPSRLARYWRERHSPKSEQNVQE